MPGEIVPYRTDYETVAISQSDQALGPVGNIGDVLVRLICTCSGAGVTNTVSIKDGGGSAIPLIPAAQPAGTYVIEINARSLAGAWKVTTAATVTVLAVGRFT